MGNVHGEGIDSVSILVKELPNYDDADVNEIDESMWESGFRVFIIHRVKDKEKATKLKKRLARFGITAFVAHEDIEPSKNG